jgi:cholesterol transport system auxiliary component
MKQKLVSLMSAGGILFYAAAIAGCGGHSYNRNYYVLAVAGPEKTGRPPADITLAVRRFTIDSAFQSTALVYRKSEFGYQTDFYNHFLISPADMITQKTRNWLAASADFATVVDAGSTVSAAYILQGNVIALYGDFRPNAPPKAVMEIRFFLIADRPSPQKILLNKEYTATHDLKAATAGDLVAGFDVCLASILKELQADLSKAL